MAVNTRLILTREQIAQIEREGCAAYPNECCGAIIGHDVTDTNDVTRRIVDRLSPLANSFESDEQYHRFRLNPLDLVKVERDAGADGKLVLGFYHSHPDHPARPSEYDRQHAWPFYSYVIVAIEKRKPVDLTSWQLDEVTEQFRAEAIAREE
jgi:proteasome lid subunit RPN8/RPN11